MKCKNMYAERFAQQICACSDSKSHTRWVGLLEALLGAERRCCWLSSPCCDTEPSSSRLASAPQEPNHKIKIMYRMHRLES